MRDNMTEWNLAPGEIERRSFEIIDDEAPDHKWPVAEWSIIRRMIHTSADFEYVESARFHPEAVRVGMEAVKKGKIIITDTRMALSGISSKKIAPYGVEVQCLIDHEYVVRRASETGTTRAVAAVDAALEKHDIGIYVVGNAPTALFRLLERTSAGEKAPDLVVGLPVGFVNAAESKAALLESSLTYITNVGRKGGSNIAASVINALVGLCRENEGD